MPDLKYITTDKNSGFPEYLDFATLRKLGIQHIAELSGKIWTDHNLHDPGITILEALCYVLTDLDYRTKLDFKDLIAAPAGAKGDDNFYTAARILGNNPLTITDIRRMLIDVKGVRNAWLVPINEDETEADYSLVYDCGTGVLDNTRVTAAQSAVPLKGLYRVYIEPDDVYAAAYEKDACGNDVFPMETVLSDIDQRLHAHRNLCEDFPDVVVLEKEPVSLCLHIELAANYDPDEVLLNIYSSIQDFLSPAPVFYSLQQLLDKGRSMEEIFEGRPYEFDKDAPLQQNGFVDVQELESLERITTLQASDLYRIIMKVPGVAGITRLLMTSFDEYGYALTDAAGNPVKQEGEEWCLRLKKDHRPVLSPETSNVIFFRNRLQFGANNELVSQRYKKGISDYNKFPKAPASLDTIVPKGRQLDLAQYSSVQYELPKVYMVGKHDVPGDATAARKAQALQLQAYLLFFDRLLADYFAQLSSVRKLFSLGAAIPGDERTYFPADLSGIPQLPSLLRYKKQLPLTTQGKSYNGMQLAYEPAPGGGRKAYNSMYLRDEVIRRIISECSNNTAGKEVRQLEDTGNWYFVLTDSGSSVLLESAVYFTTAIAAEQAALDVIFLATLPGSYSRNNNRKDDIYTFDLVFNDAGDTEMLTVLYETAEQYQARKERFLDHLLARFSEDFTDYALMMYNISGRKNDPERNLADKAAFLSAYPETSANRALAFNYKTPGTGFPVCGLEKRVAGLMGIRQSPSASLSNFDLVHAEKQTGFICRLPHQETPLFVSSSLHTSEEINSVFSQFLELGKQKANYKPFGCTGEGVYGFSIESPATAASWIAAKCSVQYTTPEERDVLIDWFVQFFQEDGQYKVYPQTQEGYYFQLPDDYGKTLLKSRQGVASQEEALSLGYDCLEVLQHDAAWEIEEDVAAANFRIIIVQETVQIAYHPQTFGTAEAAEQKKAALQAYFRQHYLTYQREATEVYNWTLSQNGQVAWEGIVPYKDKAQLPVAFIQFIELAAKADNYHIVQTGDGVFRLQVVRTETGEEEGELLSTLITVHLQSFASGDAAQQAMQTNLSLFSQLWLTVSEAVKTGPAAIYYFKDLEAAAGSQDVLLTTTRPVPDGPAVTQITRNIIRSAANPRNVSIRTLDNYSYVVEISDDAGQLLAESGIIEDHGAALRLMEKILLKAGQDVLWVEKGAATDGYGIYWQETSTDTPLMQSIGVWETRAAAVQAFVEWILTALSEDIQPSQQPGNGYGYTITTRAGIPFAKQGQWSATVEERDGLQLLLKQQLAALQANAGWADVTRSHFYFKISDTAGLLLQEPHFYTSYDEVRTAFYTTMKFGKQRQYYLLTIHDNCTYGFRIIDNNKEVLAVHPFEYTTTDERDAAVERTLRFLQEHGQIATAIKLAGAWKYSWQWLSCCCWYPETALEGLDEKPEKEDAEKTLVHIIKVLAPQPDNYEIVQEESGYRVFLKEGEDRVAVHPQWYDCAKEAEQARDRLVAWSGFKLSNIESGSYTILRDVRTDLFKAGDHEYAFGYRLWDRDYRIARYTRKFESNAERTAAVAALLQRYQRRLPVFTALERGASAVIADKGLYYYQLRRNDLLLWQSINAYPTAAAAAAAFETASWELLQRTLRQEHYSPWTPLTEELFLNDDTGQPIAVAKITPGSYEAYIAAIRERQQFARKHGVYRNEAGSFSFHIYNTKAGVYEWDSIHRYATPAAAEEALLEFRQLLLFRGNYCLDDETVGCYYSLTLGKVLLDIQHVTRKCEDDKEEMTKTDAWDRLQVFLDNLDPDNRNFFPYTDYAAGCRYAFRMVDDSSYRVAQHTGWYQGMERREEERMSLLADIYCKRKLYGWFVKPVNLNTDPHILDCYFAQPEKINFGELWMSYGHIPAFDQIWQVATETLPAVTTKLYYYQLFSTTDEQDKVMWKSVSRYNTPALAKAAEAHFYVYLLEMARSAASYYYEQMAGCDNAYTLYLKDMDGKVIAVAPGIICGEDIENDRASRMFNAMMFPVVENGKKYSFEINNITQLVEDTITYEAAAIWESVHQYDTPEEAREALNIACTLLSDLRNYQRGDEDTCGPFSVTLVNPEGVLAEHPLTYTSITARDAAMEHVLQAISAEGMHVLEHILMRPRSQQQSYESWQLELEWYAQRESPLTLRIINEGVFADAASFLDALKKAAAGDKVFVDTHITTITISFYQEDERIAMATLPATAQIITLLSDLSQMRTAMQTLLNDVSDEMVSQVVIPVVCTTSDAMLPVCTDVCFCCDEEEEATDPENARYCDKTFLADPYSFWATVVLPAWPQRFRLARFRQFFEDTLRREAPAHIRLNIVWISPQQMLAFESAWKQWLMALSREESCEYEDSLKALNKVLKDLKNVYPAAYMWDDEGGDDKPLILLDEAMLG
ncbi:hypothetical protein [Chitinophaga rhizophila]|uniref:Virulence plasmid A protein n=1 Tax=Chitinophaga rhizophila TaxID=2866212 RepID=A0ABS7G5I0_9BACT|nr:hypothetical protein [Chitinophaga rhizophila]MBW8682913.1 hypothetical protein [Chitinophaga rhizophila]